MKTTCKATLLTTLTTLLCLLPLFNSAAQEKSPRVRKSWCTQRGWFKSTRDELASQVDGFLANVPQQTVKSRPLALISPHAGFVYSGQTAAYGYKTLEGWDYDRVIIYAFSHGYSSTYRGASILDVDYYETPLGRVEVDREICNKLLKNNLFQTVPEAHRREHSLESQLPFLQRTVEDFKLVPILFGKLSREQYAEMSDLIRPFITEKTLVVASSDFTHYGPNYRYLPFKDDVPANIRKLDYGAIDAISRLQLERYVRYRTETGATICGRLPIGVLIKTLPGKAEGRVLHYDTSGAITGDFSNSVSYASLLFTDNPDYLSREEQKTLLTIARDTVEEWVRTGERPKVDYAKRYKLTAKLKRKSGVFVTLTKNHRLRGCIGSLEPRDPLYLAVVDNAISSASRDSRFSPVREKELSEIEIDISVLTKPEKVSGPKDIVIGRDGIIIEKRGRRATYLPHVAPEQGWDVAETLSNLSAKARLPHDSWKSGMTFHTYKAQVFAEEDVR